MSGRPWTQEEHTLLVRLYRAGVPSRDIAKRLHRTPMAVQIRASHGGVVADARAYRRAKAVRWLRRGVPVEEVAERLRVSRRTLYRWGVVAEARHA